jgi:SAM-dependent methyltransferase
MGLYSSHADEDAAMPDLKRGIRELSPAELARVRASTVEHYERSASSFWEGTRDHDVSQNVAALLRHIASPPPASILDLGCGPGRDLAAFRALGCEAIGLDGAETFVRMAREHSGCEVWHADLLDLELPPARFDGVFANAVLFHVPSQELPRVLLQLHRTLKAGGVLFCSNPHGPDIERWQGQRYGSFLSLGTWRGYLESAGFSELEHYYRPAGLPRAEQPWLASVWRTGAPEAPR